MRNHHAGRPWRIAVLVLTAVVALVARDQAGPPAVTAVDAQSACTAIFVPNVMRPPLRVRKTARFAAVVTRREAADPATFVVTGAVSFEDTVGVRSSDRFQCRTTYVDGAWERIIATIG